MFEAIAPSLSPSSLPSSSALWAADNGDRDANKHVLGVINGSTNEREADTTQASAQRLCKLAQRSK